MTDMTAQDASRSAAGAPVAVGVPVADGAPAGPMLAADGTPLKKKLAQALFVSRLRAFGLVAPLLLFILASFIIPIVLLLWQGINNDT